MSAVKGVGEGAVEAIVEERDSGTYSSIYDFVRRIDLRSANKKVMESLAYAGALDTFKGLGRHQYFATDAKGTPFLESIVKYGVAHKNSVDSDQQSLFSGENTVHIPEPPIPSAEPWAALDQLSKEKEVVGIYISGHPLDDYKLETANFCTPGGLAVLDDLTKVRNKELKFAGMVGEVGHRFTKNGKPYGVFNLEDYDNNHRFFLFGDDYVKFKDYLVDGWFLFIGGKVQAKRFAKEDDDLEYKIHKIELLADVREKLPRFMNLELKLSDISEEFTESFYQLLTSHKGNCRVKVKVNHHDNVITMPAKNLKVDLSNELIDALDKLSEVEYSLE
jgi:DNA polymerase-3 subunit alpha